MRSRAVLFASAIAALLAGCGGGHDAAEKQLAELRAEIVKLRAGQAVLDERLDNLELNRGAFSRGDKAAPAPSTPGAAPSAPPGADPDRPDLDTVRLAPDAAPQAADAEDPDSSSPRPVLKLSGDGKGSSGTSAPKKAPPKGGANKKNP